MKIQDIAVREIFDSRGNPTVEVELVTAKGRFRASVPAGKSRGKNEAAVLAYADIRRRAEPAVRRRLVRKSFANSAAFDEALLKLDGTKQKTRLGGNFMLGLSIAAARAFAGERGEETWESVRRTYFSKLGRSVVMPMIFSNLINGGAHAANGLDVQEYMAVARPHTNSRIGVGVNPSNEMSVAIHELLGLYEELGKALKRGAGVLPIGDEAGYATHFANNFAPIALLAKLIRKEGLAGNFRIALDVAATSFKKGLGYRFDGKTISAEKLGATYRDWLRREPFVLSIEDPFGETDFAGFRAFSSGKDSEKCTALVVGDDLTTTNPAAIEKYGSAGLITGVIIKPNQIGTVSEACAAITAARKNDMFVIVSHRSGETEDVFLVELARAANADAVKIGAPARERAAKFNELIRLYS